MFSKFEFLVVLSLAAVCISVVSSASLTSDSDEERDCPALDCTDLPNGEYPNPESCTSFCYCVWGKSVLTECSKNPQLHFNPIKLVCDWPQDAGCEVAPTTTTRRTTTRRTTTRRTRPTRTTTTTTTTTETPTEEPTTEPPTEAPTEEPTEAPTEAPTEEPTEAPTEAPEEPDFDCSDKSCGYYAVRNSARDYVHCSEGQGVVHTCPSDLEFSPRWSTCDLPAAASDEEF
jgi:hypothetical protein